MSLATNNVFKEKLLKDTTIPESIERLRVLGMGSVYLYAPELMHLIQEAEEDDMERLMMMKAYFSLDSSINFFEKHRKKKLFKSALKDSWGITNKKSLISEINSLLDGKNSIYANIQLNLYFELREKNLELTEENIRGSETFNNCYYDGDNRSEEEYKHITEYLKGALEVIDASKQLITKNWVMGFDLARAVHLTKMGYGVGILKENEAWEIIDEIHKYFVEFDTYREFFYSNELGNRLFDYDRGLDALKLLKARMESLAYVLVDEHTPFKYLTIEEEFFEQSMSIYKEMFGVKELDLVNKE